MRKVIILVLSSLVLVFLFSTAAWAATPQDIYNDFAADGKIDGSYTSAEIQAYLNDANVHQYGDKAILDRLDAWAKAFLRPSFPFTGFELLLMFLGGVALVGGGYVLRRSSR